MQDGTQVKIPLFPARIHVMPDPLLQFHYFWQRDVYGDDPFTPEIEPAEPFSLGLLIVNKGYGTAHNMQIASSQPQIVDNQKGLLINFKIIGTQVNAAPVAPSLQVNLGDVAPQSTTTARWLLTSTLQGKFIDYSATFKHIDDLGNPRTSLIDSVDIHELEHVVRVDQPTDDGKPDFLVNDVPDQDNLPDTVWISDGTTAPVSAITNASVDGPVTDSHLTVQLTASSIPGGFIYIRTDDPAQGRYKLLRVVRSDSREIRMDDNAWTTHRTIRLQGQAPYQQHRLYLFDKDSTGSYTLIYGQQEPAKTSAGGSKSFADGTSVTLTGVITARFADGMYMEALDRSSGVKIVPASNQEGEVINATGIMRTGDNGERYVEASTVTSVGSGAVGPLGISTKALYGGDFFYDSQTGAGQKGMAGGLGLNPVGLLISTLGKVTSVEGNTFHLDDGYGKPVKVLLPSDALLPRVGSFVGLNAIVSIENVNGQLTPLLRPRRRSDLAYAPDNSLLTTFTAPAGTLNVEWNLFSLPGIPTKPAPTAVLNHLDPGDGSGLQGRLSRFDVASQSEVFFDAQHPELFGNLLLGEGYRLRLDAGDNPALGFDGFRADFADRWISIPKLGVAVIGHPFMFAVNWGEVQVTDGTKTVSLADAVQQEFPPWLDSAAKFFDNVTQQDRILGLPEDNPDSELLLPWRGYWITSHRDNLALIIPAHAAKPVLLALRPNSAAAGGPAFSLTVVGTGLVEASTVYWNGQVRPTHYISPTQVTADITPADIAAPGTAQVSVVNPPEAGGQSNTLVFTIGTPHLVLSQVSDLTRSNSVITATISLTNSGTADAANVRISSSTLGTTPTSSSMPVAMGSIAPGETKTVQLTYPNTAGSAGVRVFLRITGAVDGATFTGSLRVTLP